MNNEEIKILSNMSLISSKIEIKELYKEEDYFNLFQLVDGFKHIEKYFTNKNIINDILIKKINGTELYQLIRLVRNRYAHIDKHNEMDKLILLQTMVKKEDIRNLITEIIGEMDNIFKRDLNNDAYKLIMNTKIIANIFELISFKLNVEESLNDFDEYSKKLLKPIWDRFDYENSSPSDFDNINNQIIKVYKSDDIKNRFIKLYGEELYDEMIAMLTDDAFTMEQAKNLMNKIKDTNKKE